MNQSIDSILQKHHNKKGIEYSGLKHQSKGSVLSFLKIEYWDYVD